MAITINATVGDANANSYVTEAEADTYFEGRLNSTAYTGASAADKIASLVQGAKLLDTLTWVGFKRDNIQALRWPRVGMYNRDGYQISSEEIPDNVKDAQCEMAIALLKEDRTEDGGVDRINSFRAGSLMVDFDTNHPKVMVPPIVKRLVAEWILAEGTIKLERA